MTATEASCIEQLDQQGRLLNPVVFSPGKGPRRSLFRGELAVKFAPVTEREKKPPEIKAEQVLMASEPGKSTLSFLACYLLSFAYLEPMVEVLGDLLVPDGKYFAFCGNIDLASRYQVTLRGATFYIFPLDEATVYNELLELLKIEKNDLKKLDSAGKLDAIVSGVKRFSKAYEAISYARGLELMGPVKNPGEHRPV
jgi:hypothetical protein